MKNGIIINSILFKSQRLKLGLTQQEVAHRLNCSISTISKLEQNLEYFKNCNFNFLLRYFDLLNINSLFFFSYIDGKIQIFTD